MNIYEAMVAALDDDVVMKLERDTAKGLQDHMDDSDIDLDDYQMQLIDDEVEVWRT